MRSNTAIVGTIVAVSTTEVTIAYSVGDCNDIERIPVRFVQGAVIGSSVYKVRCASCNCTAPWQLGHPPTKLKCKLCVAMKEAV